MSWVTIACRERGTRVSARARDLDVPRVHADRSGSERLESAGELRPASKIPVAILSDPENRIRTVGHKPGASKWTPRAHTLFKLGERT